MDGTYQHVGGTKESAEMKQRLHPFILVHDTHPAHPTDNGKGGKGMVAGYFRRFLMEIETTFASHPNITAHELYEMKESIADELKMFSRSKANFSGFSELLIMRFLAVHRGKDLFVGKRYAGKRISAKKPGEQKTQCPDITIEAGGTIQFLYSVKTGGGKVKADSDDVKSAYVEHLLQRKPKASESIPLLIQDANRVENLHGVCGLFKAQTILFQRPTEENMECIPAISKASPWHTFLILENNHQALKDLIL